MTEREKYWLWLCSAETIGQASMDKLLKSFGDIEAVFKCDRRTLDKFEWLDEKQKEDLCKYKSRAGLDELSKTFSEKGISFISCENKAYPKKLKHIFEYPRGLFYIGTPPWDFDGNLKAASKLTLAVVGARQCTLWGSEQARQFAEKLSEYGVHIISGMASGIDAAAHWGALKAKKATTAVLGSGPDVCYPVRNGELYARIKKDGCIISEYPPSCAPLAWHFPRRNRILSGLADGVLVVEARERSGSLITAGLALEQGKDIFAVPGRGCDALSSGCNNLIRQGAFLAGKPEDILDYYRIPYEEIKKNKIRLAKTENMVYSTMCLTPKYIEEICAKTALPVSDIISALYRLEKEGLIVRLGTQQYMVKQPGAKVVESAEGI